MAVSSSRYIPVFVIFVFVILYALKAQIRLIFLFAFHIKKSHLHLLIKTKWTKIKENLDGTVMGGCLLKLYPPTASSIQDGHSY